MISTPEQRMAVNAGRMLGKYQTCFVGIGTPSLAAVLAQRLLAPTITLIYESGVIGAAPKTPPLSTGSPCVAEGAAMIGEMSDVFAELQAGRIEVGLLSGAQIDYHGNLNSTVIGAYGNPRLRLPGSGGALDIALLACEVLVLMPHEPRRFVSRVDFVTSPGHDGLDRTSMSLGRGPVAIVTDRARFELTAEHARLVSVFEDFTPAEVLAGLPPQFGTARHVDSLPLPTPEEIAVIRDFAGV